MKTILVGPFGIKVVGPQIKGPLAPSHICFPRVLPVDADFFREEMMDNPRAEMRLVRGVDYENFKLLGQNAVAAAYLMEGSDLRYFDADTLAVLSEMKRRGFDAGIQGFFK